MILSNTTCHITYHLPLKDTIDVMARAGFDGMDFSTGNEEYYSDIHDKNFYLEMKKYAEDKGLVFNQAHAPTMPPVFDMKECEVRYKRIVGAMRNASYLGAKSIVVHPIKYLKYDFGENTERLFEENMKFYNSLKPYAEEYGIKVALENLWQTKKEGWVKITHSVCSTPAEFNRYLDTLNDDCFIGCLDVGHAELVCEDSAEFIKALGNKRLKALHLHDVDGSIDSHDPPYFGVIDWDNILKALIEIDYQGDFNFEVCGEFFKGKSVELMDINMKLIADTGRLLLKKYEEYKKMG